MFDLNKSTVRVLPGFPYSVAENSNQNLVFTFDRTFGGYPYAGDYLNVMFALTGTAEAGIDYVTNPNFNPGFGLNSDWGSITFYPGSSTATLTITPISDSIIEGDETVTIQIMPSGAYNIGVTQLASGTITDISTPPDNTVATIGDDELSGTIGADYIDGMDGNDIIVGGGGNDELLGQNGNDILIGGEGNDKLNGGAGKDALDGSSGSNKLWCGKGKDFVVLNSGFGRDKIFDFSTQDKFFLGTGIERFQQLNIFQQGDHTVIAKNGDILAVVYNFNATSLTGSDFIKL